jgi:hypothetical protein
MLPKPPARRQALGPPLGQTPHELDAAAAVTRSDLARAAALWRALAPPWAQDLMDAVPLA